MAGEEGEEEDVSGKGVGVLAGADLALGCVSGSNGVLGNVTARGGVRCRRSWLGMRTLASEELDALSRPIWK